MMFTSWICDTIDPSGACGRLLIRPRCPIDTGRLLRPLVEAGTALSTDPSADRALRPAPSPHLCRRTARRPVPLGSAAAPQALLAQGGSAGRVYTLNFNTFHLPNLFAISHTYEKDPSLC